MFLAFAMLAVTPTPAANVMAMEVEEKVCRKVEQTGSVMRKRVCLTKAEWKAVEERNREQARNSIDNYNNNNN